MSIPIPILSCILVLVLMPIQVLPLFPLPLGFGLWALVEGPWGTGTWIEAELLRDEVNCVKGE